MRRRAFLRTGPMGLGAMALDPFARLGASAGNGISATSVFAPEQGDPRREWWREARFGMFLHWGLYSILAGEWEGRTDYAEWIRNNAHIPLEAYNSLVERFNPTRFDADAWVGMAKDAGMKYVTLTSKHHDGFCLFDNKLTQFCIRSTPFRRDVCADPSSSRSGTTATSG